MIVTLPLCSSRKVSPASRFAGMMNASWMSPVSKLIVDVSMSCFPSEEFAVIFTVTLDSLTFRISIFAHTTSCPSDGVPM